ncbi:MAG: glucose-1-phosphate adenylyltransferase [Bacteroidota bacterium]
MVALILGGGAGTRLFPLTEQRSKPAVPIAGKYRLIDIPISNCLNSNVTRMFVLTQFNSASLNKHIKNTYHFDVFSQGFVDILAAEQTRTNENWFQGTADAVRQCMPHLANHDFDYLLILSGDQLYQMDFEQFAKYHIERAADVTIATIPVNERDAPAFGIMKVNKKGYIDSFIEKPEASLLPEWQSEVPQKDKDAGKHYLASMGIYLFNKSTMNQLFGEYPDATDFGKEIIPKAITTDYQVASYQYDGYWTDIGNIRSFFEANVELSSHIPQFNLFDSDNPVYTRPRMLPPSKILAAYFRRAIVAEASFIEADKIENAIIGIRSRIGFRTIIHKVIVMGNDSFETIEEIEALKKSGGVPLGIGNNCIIENAIIDKNCRIGNDVSIRGGVELPDSEADTHCVKDGIIVLKKGATIPHGAKIGVF